MDLRVLVYNVKGFRAGVEAVAAALGGVAPDVAMVNEAGTRRRLRRFCGAIGMVPAAPRLPPLARTVRNAVLVRPPWRVVAFRLHRFANSSRFHPRGALVAHVGRAGHRAWAVSVHLGLAGQERSRHAKELTDLLQGLSGPVAVGGDFNEGPRQPAVRWVRDRFWDAWGQAGERAAGPGGQTFPARDPTARIDYLFLSEQFRVHGAEVLHGPAAEAGSDHLPLVVDVSVD